MPDELRQLTHTINALQTRIGTATELPSDLHSIQQATHKYMNHLTAYFAVRELSEPPFLKAYNKSHVQNENIHHH